MDGGFEAAPFPDGVAAPGFGAGFLFGRTRGSAAFGRRIFMGAPFGPDAGRAFGLLVGVLIVLTLLPIASNLNLADSGRDSDGRKKNTKTGVGVDVRNKAKTSWSCACLVTGLPE